MITDRDYAKDINEVILEERERCAKIAETFHEHWWIEKTTCLNIAEAIRRGPENVPASAEQDSAGQRNNQAGKEDREPDSSVSGADQ